MRISIRDGSSLVRPMSNFRISYCARYSMILSKIADRWPESIRSPSASIVSLAAMGAHSSGAPGAHAGALGCCRGTVRELREPAAIRDSKGLMGHMPRRAVVKLGSPALIVARLARARDEIPEQVAFHLRQSI